MEGYESDSDLQPFFGSSVKYADAFRIALTKQPKLLTKQKLG